MAIIISHDDKYRGYYTSIDREFQGGLNDISCAVLNRKFEKLGVFYCFNNGSLAITISEIEFLGRVAVCLEFHNDWYNGVSQR